MHQILGDMVRIQLVTKHDANDPIWDMLSAAAYGIQSTMHGTTLFTPGQLAFNKNMILCTHFEANTELVQWHCQAAILHNNARENKRRIAYNYQPGDKVLILAGGMDPKLALHQGPFEVLHFNKANGTLQIHRKNYIESINMRLVRPYFGSASSA